MINFGNCKRKNVKNVKEEQNRPNEETSNFTWASLGFGAASLLTAAVALPLEAPVVAVVGAVGATVATVSAIVNASIVSSSFKDKFSAFTFARGVVHSLPD